MITPELDVKEGVCCVNEEEDEPKDYGRFAIESYVLMIDEPLLCSCIEQCAHTNPLNDAFGVPSKVRGHNVLTLE